MMYKKVIKFFSGALDKVRIEGEQTIQDVTYKIPNISEENNAWNKAAIKLLEENAKVPSRRKEVKLWLSIPVREGYKRDRMSTNDWNGLALNRTNTGCVSSEDPELKATK